MRACTNKRTPEDSGLKHERVLEEYFVGIAGVGAEVCDDADEQIERSECLFVMRMRGFRLCLDDLLTRGTWRDHRGGSGAGDQITERGRGRKKDQQSRQSFKQC